MTDKLIFMRAGRDIEEGIDLRNSRENPFGWSTHEVWLVDPEVYPGAANETKIADLYCGEPTNVTEGFSFRVERAIGGDA